MRVSPRARFLFLLFCFPVLIAILFHAAWLTWLGSYLVDDQKPIQADIISVLGGDLRGNRILTGAALARSGYAKRVLVSGAGSLYGQHESDLAVAYAVQKGFDEKLFLKLRYPAVSTRDETRAIVREFRRLHVKTFLLVTSNFHTHRAESIFHQEAPGLAFHVIGAPDPYFTPESWWKNREGEKTFVNEWTKTVANWFGV